MNLATKGRLPPPLLFPSNLVSSVVAAAPRSLLLLLLVLDTAARGAEPGVSAQPLPVPATSTATNSLGRFYTWPEIRRTIDQWQREHPQLIHEESLGKTAEGRDIPILRISDDADGGKSDKPQIVLMGGIHPREQQPQIAIMRLGGELLGGYGHDDRITRLVKTRQIWLIPALNVDGKIYDMSKSDGTVRGANWRKNRSKGAGGALGVDLNRNFAIRWGGGSLKPGAATYQGPAPLSEPETRALAAFLESHPVRVFVDMHSHMRAIFQPMYLIEGEHARYASLMHGIFAAQKSRYRTYTNLPPAGASPRDTRGGDTGLSFQFTYYAAGVYSFNLEFGGSSFYDPPARIEQEYRDNVREPLLYLIDRCAELPLRREGTAKCDPGPSAPPLKAGGTEHWAPQITGPCDYAVLTSLSPDVLVTSEYRTCPIREGFTLKVSKDAKPGTRVPFRLYLWTADHARSVTDLSLTIARP
jgi:carboxypeptidase T